MLSVLYYIFLVAICTMFLVLSALALLLTFPFDRARRTVHELSRMLVRIFYAIPPLWSHRVIGLEHIDRSKSYVIVPNHQTMIDIPSLYFVPLNFRWVSKREVFKIPFFGQFLWLHGDICIDRGRATAAMEKVLHDGKKWLSRGASVAIFPEGTRSHDGQIHRFKAGAFTLAREAGVEILPVVMDGTTRVIRSNGLFNWRNRLTICVLPPMSVERVKSADTKELMTEVHDAMCEALVRIKEEK
ncbi:MAG TPA: 1-acyl-sn-glycerol-3-phosphate acyltransferase [Candidatus Alistipes avicola]|uniref:1-acyl-sn-glycerol-3-phosphate acyltransferase n=1 Tax=Candidatus Alistipes avicola TaxID=2838432 RepID=A0A9D2L555_9BACT|nr:lysophospholipid acyltransferase family protein [uncultured Alistipes sp.]HJA99474.1 1-acyl-sn-glycerol-3-phosphate acyltransferase [Candidatus Alistipes avicola]